MKLRPIQRMSAAISSQIATSAATLARIARAANAQSVLGPSLLVLLILLAPGVADARQHTPRPREVATVTTESWSDLSRWQWVSQPCWAPTGGSVVGVCQSSALRSRQIWDPARPWSLAWRMRARNETPNAQYGYEWFFGGAGWWVCDDDCGAVYVSGFAGTISGSGPWIGTLPLSNKRLDPYVPWTWVEFRQEWQPGRNGGQTDVFANGDRIAVLKSPRPTGPLRANLVCSSVGAATPDDGSSARCEVGPIQVVGAPL